MTAPPRIARAVLAAATPSEDRAFLVGDAGEEFAMRAHRDGATAARRWYWRQATASLAPLLYRRLTVPRPPAPVPEPSGDQMRSDLRYALRTLARARGFTLAAALTIALGVGANTTMFSVINAILLRPPEAMTDPERLVALYTSDFSGPPFGTSSYPDFEEFRKQSDVFAGVASFAPRPAAVGTHDDLQRVGLELVSDNYFQVLGVSPAAGRPFTQQEAGTGREPAAVISYGLWQRRFGGDPAIIGKAVRVNARPFTIVGVAPKRYTGAFRGLLTDVWVPIALGSLVSGEASDLTSRGNRSLLIYARLAPGVTLEQARSRMAVVAGQLHAAYPRAWTDVSRQGRRITVLPEREARVPPQIRGPALGFAALLMATVGLVLLVCCANVAGLLLARAAGRIREIGIRLSLGASRRRVIRQMLTESVVLAALGGVLGTVLAVWATRALSAFSPPTPVWFAFDFRPDARVLAFTLAVTLITGVLFGLAPALRASRPVLVTALKSDAPTVQLGRRRFTLQAALVAGQVALSLLLLVGALLFVRTLRAAALIDPGFRVDQMLLVNLGPRPGEERGGDPNAIALEITTRVAAIPGVRSVSWAGAVPLDLGASRRSIVVEGYRPRDGEDMEFHYNAVGPGYFETMEIPLARGRGFAETDRVGSPGVVVVNEAMARRFWPGEDAVGKRIGIQGADGPYLEVVGVARDGRYLSLAEPARPYLFYPQLQVPDGVILHVRTTGDPRRLTPAVRREVAAVAPDWLAENPRTLEAHVGTSLLPQRIAGGVLGLFGAVALLLSAVGLYGVVAFAVAQRTREIGIRVALGARSADVLRLVLRQGAVLVALGLAIGLPLAVAGARLLSGFLLGSRGGDWIVFAAAAAALAGVAVIASYVPARRAARVDPVVALRSQ